MLYKDEVVEPCICSTSLRKENLPLFFFSLSSLANVRNLSCVRLVVGKMFSSVSRGRLNLYTRIPLNKRIVPKDEETYEKFRL